MTTQSANIVQRLWNYCKVLRDDGASYGDYVDQRLRQAVLKRAFERMVDGAEPEHLRGSGVNRWE
jgi:type I restriction enzyme M protein